VVCALALLAYPITCGNRQDLAVSVKGGMQPVSSSINNLVKNIKSYVYDSSINIQTSQIESYINKQFSYEGLTGAVLTPPTLASTQGLNAKQKKDVEKRNNNANKDYENRQKKNKLPMEFQPYQGLDDLDFGKTYQNIKVDQSITVKKNEKSWGKITAQKGTRDGTTIDFAAVYGWSYGDGQQQYGTTKVKSCKKFLFWTISCGMKTVKVPRGYFVNELQQVDTALHNPVYQGLSNTLTPAPVPNFTAFFKIMPKGRLLSLSRKARYHMPTVNVNQFQLLTGVPKAKAGAAIQRLLNSQVSITGRMLAARNLKITDERGRKHLVSLTPRGKHFNLQVFSSA